ncbi:hypothetical protein P8C59_000956 [Phyllachora maydis]|uniref:Uncharacterized protein n=1 Tax=Phyllachora maydis TaxID=1825666 RepID=A0AAD9HYR5_9PEZI|nr:hypothetical protein P8C59_000956 [Phyllachora maydis]
MPCSYQGYRGHVGHLSIHLLHSRVLQKKTPDERCNARSKHTWVLAHPNAALCATMSTLLALVNARAFFCLHLLSFVLEKNEERK